MILILFGVFVYCGPPTAFFDFLKNKGSTFWDRAKQIIGGKDANRSDNLGQYDRVGFAAVPDQYDPDDFDDDEYANREDQSKEILTPKKTPPDNKKNQEGEASKDLLADDDNEEEPLEL